MEKPLVSVIMPVYNGEKYIGKAIESVLAQKISTELLVIDDCSTDGTELAVMKFMDSGNIRYIRNNENLGAAGSRNRGVKEARGKYVAFLDADDWWEEGKLSAQTETMEITGCVNLFHRKRTDEAGRTYDREIYSGRGAYYLS